MIDVDRAKTIAIAALGDAHEWVVRDARELELGWVIAVVNREYAETGDINTMVPGVGPIVVTHDGKPHLLPTSVPPHVAIAEFERRWRAARTP